MDLLAGYGSDNDSDHEEFTSGVVTKPTAAPGAVRSLTDLPAPLTTYTAPLFSGLPSSNPSLGIATSRNKISKKKKKLIARFGVPIDYGDAVLPSEESDDDGTAFVGQKNHMKKKSDKKGDQLHGTTAMMSMSSFLPPPTTIPTPHGVIDNPGVEAATAAVIDNNNPLEMQTQYIEGEYQGQRYMYDPSTGQYYYPDHHQPSTIDALYTIAGASPITTANDATSSMVNNVMVDDKLQLPPGIQFKEISGAALRHMEPAARAEIDAVRSALGPDYEERLRKDASKVGNISKLAKRKHQLSSLYVHAKDQELEELEKGTGKNKSRASTMKKYGW